MLFQIAIYIALRFLRMLILFTKSKYTWNYAKYQFSNEKDQHLGIFFTIEWLKTNSLYQMHWNHHLKYFNLVLIVLFPDLYVWQLRVANSYGIFMTSFAYCSTTVSILIHARFFRMNIFQIVEVDLQKKIMFPNIDRNGKVL